MKWKKRPLLSALKESAMNIYKMLISCKVLLLMREMKMGSEYFVNALSLFKSIYMLWYLSFWVFLVKKGIMYLFFYWIIYLFLFSFYIIHFFIYPLIFYVQSFFCKRQVDFYYLYKNFWNAVFLFRYIFMIIYYKQIKQ